MGKRKKTTKKIKVVKASEIPDCIDPNTNDENDNRQSQQDVEVEEKPDADELNKSISLSPSSQSRSTPVTTDTRKKQRTRKGLSGKERLRKFRANLSEERLREIRKRDAERSRRFRERMTEEQRSFEKEKGRQRMAKCRAEKRAKGVHVGRPKMNPVERRQSELNYIAKYGLERFEEKRRKNCFYNMLRRLAQTPEQKLKTREYMKKYHQEHRGQMSEEQWNDYLEKTGTIAKVKYQEMIKTETPEERQKRLRYVKINGAKNSLKKKLKKEGVPLEEIQRRTKELVEQMWQEPLPPPETVSEYKPRPWMVGKRRRRTRLELATDSNASKRKGRPLHSYKYKFTEEEIAQAKAKVKVKVQSTSTDPINKDTSQSPSDDGHHDFNDHHDHDYFGDDFFPSEDLDSFGGEGGTVAEAMAMGVNISSNDNDVVPFELQEETHLCSECGFSFISEDAVKTHFKFIHPQLCLKCKLCSEFFMDDQDLSEHLKEPHVHEKSVPPSKGENVDLQFLQKVKAVTNRPLLLMSPLKTNYSNNYNFKFGCLRCMRTFERKEQLFEHVKKVHRKSFWPCDICKILKYSEKSLRFHSKCCRKVHYGTD